MVMAIMMILVILMVMTIVICHCFMMCLDYHARQSFHGDGYDVFMFFHLFSP